MEAAIVLSSENCPSETASQKKKLGLDLVLSIGNCCGLLLL